jgi:hypothetical protein
MASDQTANPDLAVIRAQVDLADRQIGRFRVKFVLNPKFMSRPTYRVEKLSWSSVPYGPAGLDEVPNNTRGIYAFVVSHCHPVLPRHGYVVYVGIGGRKSNRSLRARYRDYLNTKKILKRDRVAAMIGKWADVLQFVYAPVDNSVSSDDLIALEQDVNGALLPPYSPGDRKARLKAMERMFP